MKTATKQPQFYGRVVLITWGTAGIGAATVKRISELGANVLFTGRHVEIRDVDVPEALAKVLRQYMAGKKSGTLLFKSRKGNPLQQRNINRDWLHPLLEKVGLFYGKPTFRPSETVSVNTSAFVGTNRTGEPINSGLPVIRPELLNTT